MENNAESPTVTTIKRRNTPGRKFSTPRKPRVIDPGVLAIRKEASERIKEYHQASASPKVLEKILNQLGKLTGTDLMKLNDHVGGIVRQASLANAPDTQCSQAQLRPQGFLERK